MDRRLLAEKITATTRMPGIPGFFVERLFENVRLTNRGNTFLPSFFSGNIYHQEVQAARVNFMSMEHIADNTYKDDLVGATENM